MKDLDKLYKHLLSLYKSNYKQYIEEVAALKDQLQTTKNDKYVTPYPDLYEEDFNQRIYTKKEFYMNQMITDTDGKEFEDLVHERCSFTDFKLTANQKFVKNFISPYTPYRGLLLFHSVGVGKTCTAISIAEQYLNETMNPKKVLVILSSNLKDNFKKQIFDITKYDITSNSSLLCTGTKYPDMVLDKSIISKELLEKRISKLIKERYQFVGYVELVELTKKIMENIKKIERNPDKHQQRYDEKIKELFSSRLIIVDEAHNLRMQAETGSKRVSNTLSQILKTAENTKLVLMSATPMFDNAREIVWMLNMLLSNDKRPVIKVGDVFDSEGNVTEKGKHVLISNFRGYVSYMRGENPFAFPFRLYPSINKDPKVITKFPKKDAQGNSIPKDSRIKFLELVGSSMSKDQLKLYNKFKKSVKFDEDVDSDSGDSDDTEDGFESENDSNTDMKKKKGNVLQNVIQISNIAYPGEDVAKMFGKPGFVACFDKDKNGVAYKESTLKKYGEILAYDEIGKYSPKIKTIVDYIIKSEGIVFVYSQYYFSGIFPLILALEHIGMRKYNAKNIGKNLEIKNKFGEQRPSYIVISKDKSISPNNDSEIAAAKSSANANGELIKVIIVSKVGTEGIDFKRIREVHLLEPWFNLNRAEQIIGRAIRTCSHIDLPPKKRNVTVYHHCSIVDDKEESIDMKTYRVAEQKQIQITAVQRLLKETAIDCNLNINALIFSKEKLNMNLTIRTSQGKRVKDFEVGDKDNSYVCDFSKCEIKCKPSLTDHGSIDVSTFNTYFVLDDIDIYKKYVESLFKNAQQYTFAEMMDVLIEMYTNIDAEILAYTLDTMVNERTKIVDSSYQHGYLIYKGDLYIFQSINSHETRLSLEERKARSKKNRIEFDPLLVHSAEQDSIIKKKSKTDTSVEENNDKENKTDSKVKNKKTKKDDMLVNSIGDHVSKQIDEKMTVFKEFDVSKEVVVDSVVDKLTQDSLFELILYIKQNPSASISKLAYKSIQKLRCFVGSKTIDDIRFFYNHFDGDYYTVKQDGLKKSGPLELASASEDVATFEKMLALNSQNNEHKGYIAFKKDDANFKIRDNNKTVGYVCHQTSSLSIDDFKKRINAIVHNTLPDKKYSKKFLCELYEMLLRTKGNDVFKRPLINKI